ncbi:hypothetical protein AB4254_10995 [Vibrio breoganii]
MMNTTTNNSFELFVSKLKDNNATPVITAPMLKGLWELVDSVTSDADVVDTYYEELLNIIDKNGIAFNHEAFEHALAGCEMCGRDILNVTPHTSVINLVLESFRTGVTNEMIFDGVSSNPHLTYDQFIKCLKYDGNLSPFDIVYTLLRERPLKELEQALTTDVADILTVSDGHINYNNNINKKWSIDEMFKNYDGEDKEERLVILTATQ